LLNWFFGILGAHRFYVGKIGTGFIMLVTFGGLGVWSLVDLIFGFANKFRDSQGRAVTQPFNMVLVIILIPGLSIYSFFLSIPIMRAIDLPEIPNITSYLKSYRIDATQNAYHSVALAQEAYYAQNNVYSDSYEDLERDAGLVAVKDIKYGPIKVYFDEDTGKPGYQFIVAHKSLSIAFSYDSIAEQTVTRLK
jgi:hypothetical protein